MVNRISRPLHREHRRECNVRTGQRTHRESRRKYLPVDLLASFPPLVAVQQPTQGVRECTKVHPRSKRADEQRGDALLVGVCDHVGTRDVLALLAWPPTLNPLL